MRKLVKTLAISGLAICAGPFSLGGHAQDYIDLEAERAASNGAASNGAASQPGAAVQSGVPADPYGTQSAQAYPATSYGVNKQPVQALPSAPVAPGSAPASSGSHNLGNLFYQLQQLQQEVMMLNGKVEEQAHELRKLKKQNLERYVDIDRRLGAQSAPAAATTATPATSTVAKTPASGSREAAVPEQPGEGDAYRGAYSLVRAKRFDEAVDAFKQFLQDYPAGKYAPNAYYWLGELYLVIKPVDLESARQALMLLLNQYPDNSKIPDALYKLGKVQYAKGNRDKAREFLDRVINEYGSGNSSAVKLAQDFIRENY